MARISFECPHCARPMHATLAAAGKRGQCKQCGCSVRVPGSKPTPSPVALEVTTQPETVPAVARRPLIPRWFRHPATIVLLLIVGGIAWNVAAMTRVSRWTSEDGSSDYTDTYSRWGNTLQHRDVLMRDSDDELYSTANGPMSASGQPHGEWSIAVFQPTIDARKKFYWYGEEISEGEWREKSDH